MTEKYRKAPSVDKKKYITAIVLFICVSIVTYGNRMVLSPLMTLFEDLWDMTGTELGVLNSAFYLSYFLCQIPAGMIGDKWSRKKLLCTCLILQGVFGFGCGLTTGFYGFMVLRILTGMMQSVLFTSIFSIVPEYLPEKIRTLGIAIIHAAMPFGIVYGMVMSSQVVFSYHASWNVPFMIAGVLTVLVGAVLILFFSRTGTFENKVTEPVPQETAKEKKGFVATFREILTNRNLVALSVTGLLESYGVYVMFTWLPYYLTTKGFGEAAAGTISSFSSVLTIPATVLVGVIVYRLGKIKNLIMCFMPISVICYLMVVFLPIKWVLIAALAIYGFFGRMTTAPLHVSLAAASSDKSHYSTSMGFYNAFCSAGMFLSPILTGYILDITGTLTAGLYLTIVIQILAIIVMAFGVKEF